MRSCSGRDCLSQVDRSEQELGLHLLSSSSTRLYEACRQYAGAKPRSQNTMLAGSTGAYIKAVSPVAGSCICSTGDAKLALTQGVVDV